MQKTLCDESFLPKQTVNQIITSFYKQGLVELAEVESLTVQDHQADRQGPGICRRQDLEDQERGKQGYEKPGQKPTQGPARSHKEKKRKREKEKKRKREKEK
ncbi:MAG: hypothetical protein LBE38_04735 [Deltaproteobacteria bacterium]|nr:hypothetical protein [Deltaproteobacteria bacterium]